MADATCWAFPWPRLVLTWVLQTRSVSDFIYLVEVGFGNICDVTEVSWQWDTSLDSNFILHIQLTQTKGDFTVQDSLNVPVLTVTCPKRSCMEPLRNHVGTQCFSLNISDFECLDYGCSACTSAVTCLHLGSPRSNPPPPELNLWVYNWEVILQDNERIEKWARQGRELIKVVLRRHRSPADWSYWKPLEKIIQKDVPPEGYRSSSKGWSVQSLVEALSGQRCQIFSTLSIDSMPSQQKSQWFFWRDQWTSFEVNRKKTCTS